ncbi:hypothetical protein [Sphingomonas adhaesiva]|uniref:Uncharacterized protein n=1 Tax=Sphingomonas adhaesiva TaxID=28212 RepID=A0A2A4I4A1_9SPHN|nr:hypothetical protein [Sphingomonas adhaesiva]PCG12938.1 hypothetical protein COA07_17285 [Sphingomonas adhaesiva]
MVSKVDTRPDPQLEGSGNAARRTRGRKRRPHAAGKLDDVGARVDDLRLKTRPVNIDPVDEGRSVAGRQPTEAADDTAPGVDGGALLPTDDAPNESSTTDPDDHPSTSSALARHLAAIDGFSAELAHTGERLVRGPNGGVALNWAARRAGVPLSAFQVWNEVRDKLLALRHFHRFTDEPAGEEDADGEALRPPLKPADTEAWIASAPPGAPERREADVAAALDGLEAWDVVLNALTETIPSYKGRPVRSSIATRLGVPPETLDHPAVERFVERLARKHGVAAPRSRSPHRDAGRTPERRKVDDAADTLQVRGQTWDTLPSGIPSIPAIIDLLDLNPALMFRPGFRAHVLDRQRRLVEAAGGTMPAGNDLHLAVTNAVVDTYALLVDAGLRTPPISLTGAVRLREVESELGLVKGTSTRFPEIATRIQAIAAGFMDARAQARREEERSRRVALIVGRMAELAETLGSGTGKIAVNHAGAVSRKALEASIGWSLGQDADDPRVTAAIERLVARVGLAEGVASAPRREVTEMDLKVADYCDLIRRRGFGPPRLSTLSTLVDKEGAAGEMDVPAGNLTQAHVKRIRAAAAEVRGLNPLHCEGDPLAYRMQDREKTALIETMLSDPIFDAGLPGHPFDDRRLDLPAIANVLAIPALFLRRSPAARALIDAKMVAVGIAPHPGDRSGITYAELRRYGRGRTAKEAEAAMAAAASSSGPGSIRAAAPAPTGEIATDGLSTNPAAAAARDVRALERHMRAIGRGGADAVGLTLLRGSGTRRLPHSGEEMDRWRRYQAELAILRADHPLDLPFGAGAWGEVRMSFGHALSLLLRAKGETSHTFERTSGLDKRMTRWIDGETIPTWQDEEALGRLNDHLGAPKGFLAGLLNPDFRSLGKPRGHLRNASRYDHHLPYGFWSEQPNRRRELLREVASNYAVQDTEYSRRLRVLQRDEYRFLHEDWPEALKAEWAEYEARWDLASAKSKREGKDFDVFELLGKSESDFRGKAVSTVTRTMVRQTFERLFGFMTREPDLTPSRLVDPRTREDLVGLRLEIVRGVGYAPQGGMGVPPEFLTMGAIALPELTRRFLAHIKNRSGGYGPGSINDFAQLADASDANSPLRKSERVATASAALVAWFHTPMGQKAAISGEVPPAGSKPDWAKAHETCSGVKSWLRKLERLTAGPKGKTLQPDERVEKKRKAFDPIWAVLGSNTPAALYRKLIQGMIRNQPMKTGHRHRHLQDCIMVMILFQTFLRIKNVAQLTYKGHDGDGQLRCFEDGWWITIHKDRFKNGGGEYFKSGDQFHVRLRDEDGLYAMLEYYLRVSRQYIAMQKPAPSRKPKRGKVSGASAGTGIDDASAETTVEPTDDDDHADAVADRAALTLDDDEDNDSFEDEDHDGEAAESRFFIKQGGREFKPSQLAAKFKLATARHMAQSPLRMRGLSGLMPHGPHAVRHVGATDALKTTGSWEEAARVIQDAVSTVRQVYVFFTPEDQGRLASAAAERGRHKPVHFPRGVHLLSPPVRRIHLTA